MSLLWSKIAAMNPESNDIAHALDKAREQSESEHADDLTYVPNFDPLHKSNLHPSEHDGWMFMERAPAGKHGSTERDAPPLTTYKHGVSRESLHLDPQGGAYSRMSWPKDGEPHRYWGPQRATDNLRGKGHYDTLKQLGATPETKYNNEYIQERNRRLQDAGYNVLTSEPTQSEVPDFPPEH